MDRPNLGESIACSSLHLRPYTFFAFLASERHVFWRKKAIKNLPRTCLSWWIFRPSPSCLPLSCQLLVLTTVRKRELPETLFRFNYIGEGSLSNQRALVVIQTRARLKNAEGSTFQHNPMKTPVDSKLFWLLFPPPVFAIGTPKISSIPHDKVAKQPLFIAHAQNHPPRQG